MLKSVYELLTQLFTFAHRLNRQDVVIEKLQQETKANSELNNRLVFEHVRINDEFKRLAEREAEARKLFQAQVEIQLLRAAQSLPSAEPAALPPQAEIAQLKAQMTALLANQPNQEA